MIARAKRHYPYAPTNLLRTSQGAADVSRLKHRLRSGYQQRGGHDDERGLIWVAYAEGQAEAER